MLTNKRAHAQDAPARPSVKFRVLIAGAIALIAPKGAMAADEIVVSATKSALPAPETGTSITVIDERDIELGQYQFLADVLDDAAGLSIARNGAFGGQAALRIRGEASGRTLVIIDGVVVNDPTAPGGGFNFGNLDVADIERIEVLRGPQSILYGSEAIGGVVSIATKRGGADPEAILFAEGGSFATFRGGASVTGDSGAVDYGVSVFGFTSDGISRADKADGNAEKDGADSINATVNLGFEPAENLRVETNFRYQKARTEFDGFPPPTFFALGDTDEEEKAETVLAGARAILTLLGGAFESEASITYNAIDRANFDTGFFTFGSQGERVSAEYDARIRATDWLSFVAGAESEETSTDTSGVVDDVTVNSVFALAIVKPVAGLTLTAGGRHDDHETFGGATTARVTGAYNFEEAGLVLRGTWGEGFAAPSLFQLNFVCCGGTMPNRDLRPETSTGWDAGFDKAFGDFATLKATYFHQVTENLIDFDFGTGAYINIDATLRKGVEAELQVSPHPDFDFGVSYAFIDATNRFTGLPLLRQPRHAATMTATWRATSRLTLGTSVRYNGEEVDGGGPIDAFTKVDVRAAYAVRDSLEFFARIENATDTQYQDVLGYGEPGLSAFGGLRVRL